MCDGGGGSFWPAATWDERTARGEDDQQTRSITRLKTVVCVTIDSEQSFS